MVLACDIRKYAVIPLIVLLFYFTSITGYYLYSDDHLLFSISLTDTLRPLDNYYLRDGRPITGIVLYSIVSTLDSIGGFSLLRLVSALATAILAVEVARLFEKAGFSFSLSVFGSILIVTSPAFAVYVGWASCFLYPVSALLALLAGQLVRSLFEKHYSRTGMLLCSLLSVVFLVFSLAIYQITAFFYLIPLMLLGHGTTEQP